MCAKQQEVMDKLGAQVKVTVQTIKAEAAKRVSTLQKEAEAMVAQVKKRSIAYRHPSLL